jgi:hypothetical protein
MRKKKIIFEGPLKLQAFAQREKSTEQDLFPGVIKEQRSTKSCALHRILSQIRNALGNDEGIP